MATILPFREEERAKITNFGGFEREGFFGVIASVAKQSPFET
jgi:hypothetical protein